MSVCECLCVCVYFCVCVSVCVSERHRERDSERVKSQGKDLKEAHSQRKLAMQEFSEMSEKLTDLRSTKQRLARQLRDKEEEMEARGHKMEVVRQDVRKTARAKQEVRPALHTH